MVKSVVRVPEMVKSLFRVPGPLELNGIGRVECGNEEDSQSHLESMRKHLALVTKQLFRQRTMK